MTMNSFDSPYIRISIDWNTKKSGKKPANKIDAVVFYLDNENRVVDESYYGQLATKDGAIQNRQEDTVGGDLIPDPYHKLEQFDVELASVNHKIQAILIYVMSSYDLSTIISDLSCVIEQPVDTSLRVEHFCQEFKLLPTETHSVALGGLIRLDHGDWGVHSITEPYRGVSDLRALHKPAVEDLKKIV